MIFKKNKYSPGQELPIEGDVDQQKKVVSERLKRLQEGNNDFMGYVKPKQSIMRKIKEILNSIFLAICAAIVAILACLFMIAVWIFATSIIWIPCLTLYYIFKG